MSLLSLLLICLQASLSGATACECLGEACKWKPPPECAETFTYNGEVYDGCFMGDSHRAWCSHTANYSKQWSFCHLNCEDGCHAQHMPAACIPGNGPAIGHSDEACDCMHDECTWKAPRECSASFTYRGANYSGCTLAGESQAWCAHNKVYERKQWSNCDLHCPEGCYWHHPSGCLKKTVQIRLPVGEVCWDPPSSCAPKFSYNGQEYAGCTTANSGLYPWCSYNYQYQKKAWDYCKARPCCNTTQNFTIAPKVSFLTTARSLKDSQQLVQQQGLSYHAVAGLCFASMVGGGLLAGGVVMMRVAKTARQFHRVGEHSNPNYNDENLLGVE